MICCLLPQHVFHWTIPDWKLLINWTYPLMSSFDRTGGQRACALERRSKYLVLYKLLADFGLDSFILTWNALMFGLAVQATTSSCLAWMISESGKLNQQHSELDGGTNCIVTKKHGSTIWTEQSCLLRSLFLRYCVRTVQLFLVSSIHVNCDLPWSDLYFDY